MSLKEITRRQFFQSLFFLPEAIYGFIHGAEKKEREILSQTKFLMYHEIQALQFKEDLLYLINRGYQPVSLETLIRILKGEEIVQSGAFTFLVTCDDGLASQYYEGLKAIESIEKETGVFIPLTLFVMTKFDDLSLSIEEIPNDTPSYNDGIHSYITKGQLIEMIQKGHSVQNHTVNHADLPSLPIPARNAEVVEGERRVDELWRLAGRERYGKAFAYPYGKFRNQIELIESLGYDLAFSTLDPLLNLFPTDRFYIGREIFSRTGEPTVSKYAQYIQAWGRFGKARQE